MMKNIALIACVGLGLAGCNTWSTSNVSQNPPAAAAAPVAPENVIVTAGDLGGQPYTKVSDLKVTVNKTTAFHPNPTPEQVTAKLKQEAASIGANAVINAEISKVRIGAFSWGVRTGTGEAVRLAN